MPSPPPPLPFASSFEAAPDKLLEGSVPSITTIGGASVIVGAGFTAFSLAPGSTTFLLFFFFFFTVLSFPASIGVVDDDAMDAFAAAAGLEKMSSMAAVDVDGAVAVLPLDLEDFDFVLDDMATDR